MPKKPPKRFSEPDIIVLEQLTDLKMMENICNQLITSGFRLLDLQLTRGVIPSNIKPVGFISHRFGYDPLVTKLLKTGCKVLRVGNFPNPESDEIIPAILPDRERAGAMAADHFADRNYEHLAFVGNYPWSEAPVLYESFAKRAKERGCKCQLFQMRDKDIEEGRVPMKEIQDSIEYREIQIRDWARSLTMPVGVFSYNDRRSSLLYFVLKKYGYQVPDEVALLGLGNLYFCHTVPVPLSSIDTNAEGRADAIVNLMIRLINENCETKGPIFVPPKEVVVRQSSNLMAVPDPVVSRAIRFIWDHFTEPLSIDDVASASAVSRSLITRKFRKSLGRTVNAEIQRKRLEYSKELLKDDGLTIIDIAEDSGFQSATYFNTVFSRTFEMTPGAYRKKYLTSD